MSDVDVQVRPRKLSLETATDELQKLLDFNEIDYDEEDGNVEEIDGEDVDIGSALKSNHPKLIKAIRKGRLVINASDSGRVTCTQHLKLQDVVSGPLEWGTLSGKSGRLAAKSKIEATDFDGQVKCLAASMTKRDLREIYALEGADYTLAKALGMLFFVA
jgi:hypothetical protein